MEAIGNLHCLRSSCADGTRILRGAVAGHDLHAGALLEPCCSSFGASVGKEVDNLVTLAVGENSAKDLALAEGKVIDAKDAGRRTSGRDSRVSAPEQGVTTHRHGTPHTLTCACFSAEGEREVAKFCIEPNCSLRGERNQIGQALSERNG